MILQRWKEFLSKGLWIILTLQHAINKLIWINTTQKNWSGCSQPPWQDHHLQYRDFNKSSYRNVSKPLTTSKENLLKILHSLAILSFHPTISPHIPCLPGCCNSFFSGFSCADASHICQVLESHRGTEVPPFRDAGNPSQDEYTPKYLTFWTLKIHIPPCSKEEHRPKPSIIGLHVSFPGCNSGKLKV